jgi:hypothetical protein
VHAKQSKAKQTFVAVAVLWLKFFFMCCFLCIFLHETTGASNSPAMSHNQDGLESGLEAVLVSEDICCVLVSLLCNHPPHTRYYKDGYGAIQCHEEIDWTMDRHYRECPKVWCPCCLAVFVRGHLFMDEACSLCLTAWHLSKVKKAFRDAVLAHGLQQPRFHNGFRSSRRRKAVRYKGAKRYMWWAAMRDAAEWRAAARQRDEEQWQVEHWQGEWWQGSDDSRDWRGQSWASSSWQRPNQGYQPQNEPPILSVVHGGSGEAPLPPPPVPPPPPPPPPRPPLAKAAPKHRHWPPRPVTPDSGQEDEHGRPVSVQESQAAYWRMRASKKAIAEEAAAMAIEYGVPGAGW